MQVCGPMFPSTSDQPPPGRQSDGPAELLERRRAQLAGEGEQVGAVQPAALAMLDVRLDERLLEPGELTVELERDLTADALADQRLRRLSH